MYKFNKGVKVRLLTSSCYLLIFDPRSGDTIALEYNDAGQAKRLLGGRHDKEFFESALNFKSISFKKACNLNIIERV